MGLPAPARGIQGLAARAIATASRIGKGVMQPIPVHPCKGGDGGRCATSGRTAADGMGSAVFSRGAHTGSTGMPRVTDPGLEGKVLLCLDDLILQARHDLISQAGQPHRSLVAGEHDRKLVEILALPLCDPGASDGLSEEYVRTILRLLDVCPAAVSRPLVLRLLKSSTLKLKPSLEWKLLVAAANQPDLVLSCVRRCLKLDLQQDDALQRKAFLRAVEDGEIELDSDRRFLSACRLIRRHSDRT